MEMAEPWYCGIRYDWEEELTLTPHHTPSQSFDFIVWEKAYLDSIPAAASKEATPPSFNPNFAGGPPSFNSSSSYNTPLLVPPTPPTTSMCVDGPFLDATSMCVHVPPTYDILELSLDKERLVPSLHSPPSRNDATLMACRTDADLPPSFFHYKPRISDGGLTSLEEAVQSYADLHPHAICMPSPSRHNMEQAGTPSRRSTEQRTRWRTSNDTVQLNVNHQVFLRRSYSQPGGGISKGLFGVGSNKPTSKADSAAFGQARIYQDQCYATPAPARNHKRMSCFPASPGRRKHRQSTLDDWESTQSAEFLKNRTLDLHQQQEKLRSPACNSTWDIPLQQQNKLLSAATWADVRYMRAGGHQGGAHDTAAAGYYRNSFSDMSSVDYDHHHDAAAALNMSKLKLWGLHNRFKALCKKLCSICTF